MNYFSFIILHILVLVLVSSSGTLPLLLSSFLLLPRSKETTDPIVHVGVARPAPPTPSDLTPFHPWCHRDGISPFIKPEELLGGFP